MLYCAAWHFLATRSRTPSCLELQSDISSQAARGTLYSGGHWGQPIVAALGIGAISKQAEIKEDTAIGIIFAGMFALGIALISTVRSYAVDLSHFLFGDVLGVSAQSLWLIIIFGAIVLLTIAAFYKEFLTLSFDPILAATLRLPVNLLNNLLLGLIAVTVAVSLQTVGVALMVAMLVTPAATAYLAHTAPANHDGACRILCRAGGCDRFIFFLLFEHCIRRGDSTNGYHVFPACVLVEANEIRIMDLSSSTKF